MLQPRLNHGPEELSAIKQHFAVNKITKSQKYIKIQFNKHNLYYTSPK